MSHFAYTAIPRSVESNTTKMSQSPVNFHFIRRYLKALIANGIPSPAAEGVRFNEDFIRNYLSKYPGKNSKSFDQLNGIRKTYIRMLKQGQIPSWAKDNQELLDLFRTVHFLMPKTNSPKKNETESEDQMNEDQKGGASNIVKSSFDQGEDQAVEITQFQGEKTVPVSAQIEELARKNEDLESVMNELKKRMREKQMILEETQNKLKEKTLALEEERKKLQEKDKEIEELKQMKEIASSQALRRCAVQNQHLLATLKNYSGQLRESKEKISLLQENNSFLKAQVQSLVMRSKAHGMRAGLKQQSFSPLPVVRNQMERREGLETFVSIEEVFKQKDEGNVTEKARSPSINAQKGERDFVTLD